MPNRNSAGGGDSTALAPPTRALLLGLLATLATVALFSLSSLNQIHGLRQLQTDTIDRNRRDSLQLIRIQNDLNLLGLAMRDMLDDRDGYGFSAWKQEFRRLHEDLDDAIAVESLLTTRPTDQRRYLVDQLSQLDRNLDRLFSSTDAAEARRFATGQLQPQQRSLTATVARLLVRNHEAEERATREIGGIYDRVERNVYVFLVAMLAATASIGLGVAHYNRRLFDQLAALSEQRSTLARGLIGVQEEVFRSVSRELHDDFGQILTAVGVMLQRAEKKGLPADSPLRQDMSEIRTVVQEALEKTRGFSQALHPTILDDYGLERAIERHLQTFERQTGIPTAFDRAGDIAVPENRGIHMYRVLQEALTNVAKHSGATEVMVRLRVDGGKVVLEVEDNGSGISEKPKKGLGLIAMSERAELLSGKFRVKRGQKCGTLVTLEVPLE